MLRALALVGLLVLPLHASATEPPEGVVVAQEKPPAAQQAPKRDCERRQEGVTS